MDAATLKGFIADLPKSRELALEMYQHMLVQQNAAETEDDFYRRQEICNAVEDALILRGVLPPRRSPFPAY